MTLRRALFAKRTPKKKAPDHVKHALRSYALRCYKQRVALCEERMSFFERRFNAIERGGERADMETLMAEDRAMDVEAMHQDWQQTFMDMAFTMYHRAGRDLEQGGLNTEQARAIRRLRHKVYPHQRKGKRRAKVA